MLPEWPPEATVYSIATPSLVPGPAAETPGSLLQMQALGPGSGGGVRAAFNKLPRCVAGTPRRAEGAKSAVPLATSEMNM